MGNAIIITYIHLVLLAHDVFMLYVMQKTKQCVIVDRITYGLAIGCIVL